MSFQTDKFTLTISLRKVEVTQLVNEKYTRENPPYFFLCTQVISLEPKWEPNNLSRTYSSTSLGHLQDSQSPKLLPGKAAHFFCIAWDN